MLLSDHKPVSCLFASTVKVVDEVRFRQVYDKVMKSLDRLENESLPQVCLDKLEFTFNNVTHSEPSVDTMTVSNTGQVPVYFEFVKKLNNRTYCKSWLQISPFTGLVLPGDSMKVELRVFGGAADESENINEETTQLENILLLHLDRGKDFFIIVTVNMQTAKTDGQDDIIDQPLIQF